jgi:hypothetical protein
MRQTVPGIRQSIDGVGIIGTGTDPALRSCEAKLLAHIRTDWAVDYGTREVKLLIEYQDGAPVLIRVTKSTVKEEKLR